MKLSLEIPINGLSFGQASVNILRELYKRDLQPNIFPVGGNGELSAFEQNQDFKKWIEECIAKAPGEHRRLTPTLKLWHLNGALTGYSDKRALMTFHETDMITDFELNAIRNNDVVLVSSSYTKSVFEEMGVHNVIRVPLGFDNVSFFENKTSYFADEIICFGMGGKLEKRKHHLKAIKAWVKKYGNNPRYRLNCAISNSHIDPNSQAATVAQALEGKPYRNLNFTPYMRANSDYNIFLNVNNIYIAMSGGEGFDLPAFQSCAIGKHIVGLNAHAYKDYLTPENAVLVEPSGKEPVYDGVFFFPNQPFNQGHIFTWDDDAFIAGCEEAERRLSVSRTNTVGQELQKKFTYEKTVDSILEVLSGL